jgi:putative endonuclease
VGLKDIGLAAEKAAARHLRANGYKILERNYSSPLGEVDIVALDGDVICFVEVRARSSREFGGAIQALPKRKQRRVVKAALAYMKARKLEDREIRFDFVAVDDGCGKDGQVRLFKSAFLPAEIGRSGLRR